MLFGRRIGGRSEIRNNPNYAVENISGMAYLWTPNGASPPPNRLIITAHGGRVTARKFSVRQNTTLRFFSDDKFAVTDPVIGMFYSVANRSLPTEVITQGELCFNYSLAKYTNSAENESHNEMYESYGVIQEIINNFTPTEQSCVLTIRNRWAAGLITLSKILDALEQSQNGCHFNVIDCLFCRVKVGVRDVIPCLKARHPSQEVDYA